jgi:peroxiredoxin Q/BCP
MKTAIAWALGTMLVGGGIAAAELKVGDAAPDFTLQGTDGKTHQLSELEGKSVVVAWFPKAFTAG